MPRRSWTRAELIVAFNLYCKLRFGQCHSRNQQVIQLAQVLARTPSAVAMKLVNFASFDPAHQERGISGLGNASRADRDIWDEFNADWGRLAVESERAYRELLGEGDEDMATDETEAALSVVDAIGPTSAPTETQRLQSVRLGQAFFRSAVLASYHDQCCICQLPCPALLIASHIIPWAVRADLRLNPRNGLCLCALHDRAFDRGLLSVDSDLCLLLSRTIEKHLPHAILDAMFLQFRGSRIQLPEKFRPDSDHLAYHRTTVFQVG